MAPDRCSCTGRGARRARLAWALAPWLAVAALPKCPLCIAAYLCAIGVSAGVAAPVAGAMVPVARIAAVLSIAAIALHAVRRARRAAAIAP
jgi:hypothetical protein